MACAYVPYSRFPVGAAALTGDGRVITGCNVENASYGLTLCAECSVVSALHSQKPDASRPVLVAIAIVGGDGLPVMPCGRCRQLLWEHGGAELLVDTAKGIRPMNEILPDAFGPEDLGQSWKG